MASKSSDFRIEQRAYVKIRTLLKISSTDIHKDLEEVYKDTALPYSTVVDWPAPVTKISLRYPNYSKKILISHLWR